MQDIADRVGVSKALVSMIFRNVPGPSAHTRERVMRIAEELDYRPNRAAALLSQHRTRLIGVMAEIRNSFHAEVVEYLVDEAEQVGYEVVLGPVTRTREQSSVVDTLLAFRCEALVLLGPQFDVAQLAAITERAAVVSVGRRVSGSGTDLVRTADGRGVGSIVDHLVSLGHRDIVYAAGGGPMGADRVAGYRRAMTRHGLATRIVESGITEHAGAATANTVLADDSPPTAIVCVNDRCAIGVLDTLQKRGLAVPGDISVAGYDDSALAQRTHVGLTSVGQNPGEQARRAIAALLERLDGGRTEPTSVVLRPRLVVRSTTGPPRH